MSARTDDLPFWLEALKRLGLSLVASFSSTGAFVGLVAKAVIFFWGLVCFRGLFWVVAAQSSSYSEDFMRVSDFEFRYYF